jgi:hypothetical protein
MLRIAASACPYLICLCLMALAAAAGPSLVGTWFGQGEPYDRQQMYLDHFLANGEIHSQFRTCVKGKPEDSREDGTWQVSGKTLTIKMVRHNGFPAPRVDVYRLDLVTPQRFKETFLALNFPFDERRVPDDFKMPSCELVS